MLTLEALQADEGDCLLLRYASGRQPAKLILIDGGPRGVFNDALRKRLEDLRGDKTLDVRMVMVSHIDADHITGLLDFFKHLGELQDSGEEVPYRIRSLWHNSFEQLAGGRAAAVESAVVGAAVGGAVPAGLDPPVEAVVASVRQGNDLRNYARKLNVPINREVRGKLIRAPEQGRRVVKIDDGLTFTLVGPQEKELNRLEESWQASKAGGGATPEAVAADYLNRTVPNLSSIVVLAEMADEPGSEPKRILLTGDAGGDLMLDGLKDAGLLTDGKIHVDLLKVQHHGSSHSVAQDFFERVTADHYVISGNGRHGNPHEFTLEWLSAARAAEPYDAYLTNREGEEGLTEVLDRFLQKEALAQPLHRYHFRQNDALSIAVEL
jgi:beta-lactamase superfamily II metal-dependent hydrolase